MKLIEDIRHELTNLPGEVAHRDMIPFRLTASEALKTPIDYKLSAVLILLYKRNDALHFILTERQDYNGTHSGQISLPGGKTEPEDASTRVTALRETHEEIGIPPDVIEILGQMTDVYIPVSNFLIHPYIGFANNIPALIPDPREVKTVLHCSAQDLLSDETKTHTKIQMKNGVWMKDIPAFLLEDKIVWGATAIILNEFKMILARL
ncbi:MAG: 8-oxo-dGTP pyrophosphatase MutT (NUDIX family) [Crocinitomix sp.]|jgi:8-oxo-dGTP pyrophosphatase MutT (NUDIX family)